MKKVSTVGKFSVHSFRNSAFLRTFAVGNARAHGPHALFPQGCLDGGMVDTRDLKSLGHNGCAGSSPARGTDKYKGQSTKKYKGQGTKHNVQGTKDKVLSTKCKEAG